MEENKLEQFYCRYVDFIRCGNPILRDNIGDLFDYPYCEECQEKDIFCPKLTRLDNGRYP